MFQNGGNFWTINCNIDKFLFCIVLDWKSCQIKSVVVLDSSQLTSVVS